MAYEYIWYHKSSQAIGYPPSYVHMNKSGAISQWRDNCTGINYINRGFLSHICLATAARLTSDSCPGINRGLLSHICLATVHRTCTGINCINLGMLSHICFNSTKPIPVMLKILLDQFPKFCLRYTLCYSPLFS